MLGAVKVFLALVAGSSLLVVLQHYPQSVLGVLLVFAGAELALVCRDQVRRSDSFVMLLTAGASTAFGIAPGVLGGWLVGALLYWGVFTLDPEQDRCACPKRDNGPSRP